uniref:Dynein axonemal assembly factor 9 n=1 Tax=Callorhinchus milii TaxID=7868 RepID=A0A4W3GY54_CALMI
MNGGRGSRVLTFFSFAGIDSRYNEGCRELANYLFFDLYNMTNIDCDTADLPDEVLDDVILLIKSQSVHLYCNPVNYKYLLAYVAHWRNLHMHCLTEKEYQDEEAAEEFKIASFVNMVRDCSRIRVPYSSQGHVQKFDMFIVEKWPIIQAFALEGIGGGGFFTMTHEAYYLMFDELMTFDRQWACFFSNFDIEGSSSILEISEAQAGEVRNGMRNYRYFFSNKRKLFISRQPFILFGCHSTKENLNTYSFTFPSEGHLVRNAGNQGGTAKHMVVQCVAPRGALACSRTYFFGTSHVPCMGNDNEQPRNKELTVLPQIYVAAVEAVLASIQCYTETSSVKRVILHVSILNTFFHLFCIASMSVYDIPDLTGGKGTLGSVVFSESFVESQLLLKENDGTVSPDSSFIILTAIVPRYVSWLVSTSDSPGVVVTLIIEYKESLLPHLPIQLHSATNCLIFTLMPRSKIYKLFYSKVSKVVPVCYAANMTLHFSVILECCALPNRHFDLQKLFEVRSIPMDEGSSLLKVICANLPELDVFLQHFTVSSVSNEPVRRADLFTLLQRPKFSPSLSEGQNKMVITIITGLPGSYKEELCSFMVNVNKELGRWSVYRQAPDKCKTFNASQIQHYLSSVLEAQRNRTVRQSAYLRKKNRIIIVTPGYTDVIDVVQAIQTHPDPEAQTTFVIGAITVCVDPLCSYMLHRFLFPKYLDQCSQGLVNNVVFTNLTAEPRHPLLIQLQKLIRTANPSMAFILAEKGAVTRNADVEMVLSESSFSEPPMLRSRYLMFPGWYDGKFRSGPVYPQMMSVCLRFNRPLDRSRFTTKCKDSEKLFEICHNTMTNAMCLVPLQDGPSPPPLQSDGKIHISQPEYFVTFIGCSLKEEVLMDWLRQCTRQKPQKKAMKMRSTLTKQEIKNIHIKRHLELTPPGWFYNGIQFVNFFGEKMDYHPLMDKFIDDYIVETNKEIEGYNAELERQACSDLFEP